MTDEILRIGQEHIDDLRDEIARNPTDARNFEDRAIFLKVWICTMQQLGYSMDGLLTIDAVLTSADSNIVFNPDGEDQKAIGGTDEQFKSIDEGFSLLEQMLKAGGFQFQTPAGLQISCLKSSDKDEELPVSESTVGSGTEWPLYHGDMHHTGRSSIRGPRLGRELWRHPIGLGWRSQPHIEAGRIYAASPGIRYGMMCLDAADGRILWRSRRKQSVTADQLYRAPCSASSVYKAGGSVLVRQMGSRGSLGIARYLEWIDIETGEIQQKTDVSHIDYRAGYAPLAANDRYALTLRGRHDIEQTPPVAVPLNTIDCFDASSGERLWSFALGRLSADPVIASDSVFVGTEAGEIYRLNLEGTETQDKRDRIIWRTSLGAPVRTSPVVDDEFLWISTEDGSFSKILKSDGSVLWRIKLEEPTGRPFRQFTRPLIDGDRIFLGSASSSLYCLDVSSGELLWTAETAGWLRSRPVLLGCSVCIVTLSGQFLAYEAQTGLKITDKAVCEHDVLADPVVHGDFLYVTDTDLFLMCIGTDGRVQWKRHLVDSIHVDGSRVLLDQLAGGAYYQSKPTAADQTVYIGSPSGFVSALRDSDGSEIWRFECGSAVSAAPIVHKGKIFVGQQGGGDDFFCLDQSTGSLRWKQSIGWVWGSANASEGRIFVPGIDGFVNCLDAETGVVLWRHRTMRSTCSEPAIDEKTVFFGGWDHYFNAFDAQNGRLKWSYHVGGGCDSGAAIAVGGRVYLPSGGSGRFRCLNSETGEVLWEYARSDSNFNATPAFDGKRVFVSVSKGMGLGGIALAPSICCLDSTDGSLLWEYPGGGLTGAVTDCERAFFGATASPFFYSVSTGPGKNVGSPPQPEINWVLNLGNKMEESTPALAYGKVFVLAADAFLHAIE